MLTSMLHPACGCAAGGVPCCWLQASKGRRLDEGGIVWPPERPLPHVSQHSQAQVLAYPQDTCRYSWLLSPVLSPFRSLCLQPASSFNACLTRRGAQHSLNPAMAVSCRRKSDGLIHWGGLFSVCSRLVRWSSRPFWLLASLLTTTLVQSSGEVVDSFFSLQHTACFT